ncbi:MAG: von Willebrand factor type A domain-containing protein, partial [Acidobacteriota bacterium]
MLAETTPAETNPCSERTETRPGGETMPIARRDLIVNRLPDEALVYDPATRTAHRLPRIVALVFHHADGETPVASVVEQLLVEAGNETAAHDMLRAALEQLAAKGLLEAETHAGSTRRAFLSRGGQIAAALPVISSIVAPGPAAAVSIISGVAPVLSRLPEGLSAESYDRSEDNPFRQVRLHPVSTFSVDVDTASYSNVRRFLRSGQLPPADAVRVEEMLNYFRYDDPEPMAGEPLAVQAELSQCPWHPEHRLLRLGLQAPRVAMADLPPCNLVFLVDVSGSMHHLDKLPLLRAAMGLLIETLRPQDSVAIVVYAGAAGLVLEPTSGANQAEILAALDDLNAGGSTNGGAGIQLAYRTAAKMARPNHVNRVILATDGDFNVPISSRGELVRLVESERQRGIFLSVLGLGTGNLKDSVMEELANRGNGHYAYIDSLAEARKVLVQEAGATLHAIAKDVKLQVEWNPHEVQA